MARKGDVFTVFEGAVYFSTALVCSVSGLFHYCNVRSSEPDNRICARFLHKLTDKYSPIIYISIRLKINKYRNLYKYNFFNIGTS